nr:DUF4230 domain-containing protein [Sphingomonas profundi]
MVAGLLYMQRRAADLFDPAPETIVSASLQGLREQNRLSAFVANYVAVVTASQSRFGLSARRTLIMPGLVRYEVDLARLRAEDVVYDKAAGELRITAPPVEVVGPQIDLTQLREYDGGGLLLRISDTGQQLDAANRRAGQAELLRQARQPVPMSLARDATRRAIERSFALPLRAAALPAEVRVRFPDEPGFPARTIEQMDRSTSLRDVYDTANAATER